MVVRAAWMEAALETQNGGPRLLLAEAVGGKESGLFPEEQEDWLEGGHGLELVWLQPVPLTSPCA